MLKKIFLFLFFLFFLKVNTFWVIEKYPLEKQTKEKINQSEQWYIQAYLSIPKQNYDIEEKIKIEIILKSKNKDIKGDISILWLKNFTLISQKKEKSKFSSDSIWNIYETIVIKLEYKAKKSWEYNIWPIFLDKKLISPSKKIKITWEKLFVWNMPVSSEKILNNTEKIFNSLKSDNNDDKIKFREKIDEKLVFDNNAKKYNLINKKSLSQSGLVATKINNFWNNEKNIDISDMKDIYEMKKKYYPLPFEKISFVVIIFLIIFNYLAKKIIIFSNKPIKKDNKKIVKKANVTKKLDYKKLLKDLEKQIDSLNKQEFYIRLNKIFRLFLKQKFSKDFSSKSLKEIEKILDKKYFLIYKKIYYPEYSPYSDDLKWRKKIFKEFKESLKN